MLEHPVFSSEVNDGSQKGRSLLYVLYVCSSPFSQCYVYKPYDTTNCIQQVNQKICKKQGMQKTKYDQKVIFQNIRENELVIPHAIKVYRVCI